MHHIDEGDASFLREFEFIRKNIFFVAHRQNPLPVVRRGAGFLLERQVEEVVRKSPHRAVTAKAHKDTTGDFHGEAEALKRRSRTRVRFESRHSDHKIHSLSLDRGWFFLLMRQVEGLARKSPHRAGTATPQRSLPVIFTVSHRRHKVAGEPCEHSSLATPTRNPFSTFRSGTFFCWRDNSVTNRPANLIVE